MNVVFGTACFLVAWATGTLPSLLLAVGGMVACRAVVGSTLFRATTQTAAAERLYLEQQLEAIKAARERTSKQGGDITGLLDQEADFRNKLLGHEKDEDTTCVDACLTADGLALAATIVGGGPLALGVAAAVAINDRDKQIEAGRSFQWHYLKLTRQYGHMLALAARNPKNSYMPDELRAIDNERAALVIRALGMVVSGDLVQLKYDTNQREKAWLDAAIEAEPTVAVYKKRLAIVEEKLAELEPQIAERKVQTKHSADRHDMPSVDEVVDGSGETVPQPIQVDTPDGPVSSKDIAF